MCGLDLARVRLNRDSHWGHVCVCARVSFCFFACVYLLCIYAFCAFLCIRVIFVCGLRCLAAVIVGV